MVFIISLLVLAFVLWKVVGGPELFGSAPNVTRPKGTHHWQGSGTFKSDVAGKSFYQDAIGRVASTAGDGEVTVLLARLIPEGYNRDEEFAVRVELNGNRIGYLSKTDAPKFRRKLTTEKIGAQVTTCNAKIRGDGAGGKDMKSSYGVFLDI